MSAGSVREARAQRAADQRGATNDQHVTHHQQAVGGRLDAPVAINIHAAHRGVAGGDGQQRKAGVQRVAADEAVKTPRAKSHELDCRNDGCRHPEFPRKAVAYYLGQSHEILPGASVCVRWGFVLQAKMSYSFIAKFPLRLGL